MAQCCICRKDMDFFSSRKFVNGKEMCEECKARLKLLESTNSRDAHNIVSTRRKLIDFMENTDMESEVKEELRKRIDDSYEFTQQYIESDYESDKRAVCSSNEEYKRMHPKYTSEQKYEYKIETVSDSTVLGKIQVEAMENILRQYAQEGWRLHSAITNEIGKNAVAGINATINQTIFIFEREVIREVEKEPESVPEIESL